MLAKVFLALFFLTLLAAAPWVCDRYALSVLVFALYMACVGQSWNLLLGYSGQLSLGHALYSGLGAYLATAFFLNVGISPFLSIFLCFGVAAFIGSSIVALSFRFGIKNVQFTLLTITFAFCCQILFENWPFFGANGGLFIPLSDVENIWHLRLNVTHFYYLFLALCIFILMICIGVVRYSKLGYFAQAIRDNEMAAQSLGIPTHGVKMGVIAISAGLTAVCGVFYAFYQNSLFPDQAFSNLRSIEMIMGPIFGGIGTFLGPIVGSFILIPMGETLSYFLGENINGIKHLFYGALLLIAMLRFPNGVWPVLQRQWPALR